MRFVSMAAGFVLATIITLGASAGPLPVSLLSAWSGQ